MTKIKKLYLTTGALLFALFLVTVSILVVLQDPAAREDPGKATQGLALVMDNEEFFTVGRIGNYLILETCTERTNGLETQIDEAGKKARFLNGSQDKEGS
jgi:hypothetical protein